jgi:hypothetical protein
MPDISGVRRVCSDCTGPRSGVLDLSGFPDSPLSYCLRMRRAQHDPQAMVVLKYNVCIRNTKGTSLYEVNAAEMRIYLA